MLRHCLWYCRPCEHSRQNTWPDLFSYLQEWNAELAKMAQAWAEGCKYEHGQPTGFTPPTSQTGQNLFTSTAKTLNLDGAIMAWWNEKTSYTYDTKACSGVCGHYTQVSSFHGELSYTKVSSFCGEVSYIQVSSSCGRCPTLRWVVPRGGGLHSGE